MADTARWIASALLGGPFGLLILGNWLSLIGALLNRRSTSLALPFIGGPVCALACLLCPDERIQSVAWLPLILDPSLLFGIPAMIAFRVTRMLRDSP
jgi:hypothetical protein